MYFLTGPCHTIYCIYRLIYNTIIYIRTHVQTLPPPRRNARHILLAARVPALLHRAGQPAAGGGLWRAVGGDLDRQSVYRYDYMADMSVLV